MAADALTVESAMSAAAAATPVSILLCKIISSSLHVVRRENSFWRALFQGECSRGVLYGNLGEGGTAGLASLLFSATVAAFSVGRTGTMLTAQRQSIRLLQIVLVAAVAVPALLFCFAAWQGYKNTEKVAADQIDRSRDVLNEHALKVFEAVERSIAEINEIIRDMPDAEISANQQKLHDRLERMINSSPEVKSFWIFDRNGHPLVNSLTYPAPNVDFSDRDYFKAHVTSDIGTFIGEVLRPRSPYGGAPFFGVSRRRITGDGSFAGVIQVSVLPEYFEGFYSKIGKAPGSYFSLIRADGLILARYPALDRDTTLLPPQGQLMQAFSAHPIEDTVTVTSLIDGVRRRVNYLKLPDLPVYVLSGMETAAIQSEWIAQMGRHLIFGIPATGALIIVVALALRRTRTLYEEAKRRQLAEGALKQAQRLEALGQLTGGVAHDFNNLLMVVGGSARKLRRTNKDSKELASLHMIEAAVQKGERLTRKLLAFSRRQNLSPEIVDLPECVRKLRGVLEQSVQGNIEIEILTPSREIAVKVDPDEFEIALLNLTLNARDAMPDGGRITITVGTRLFAAKPERSNVTDMAFIEFTDNGIGIPDSIRERIFEPFFTTKPVDKGTGLGLSQVYGFVQQSNGSISVSSTPGGGATFTILLPISAIPAMPKSAPVVESASKQVGKATVLLVEDHPDVSAVASDYLEQFGCKVLSAHSAEAAIEALNRRRDIDLVLSDIIMPGMSGLELARLVREYHPEIAVILASGYSDKAAVAGEEGFTIIRKPYSPDVLQRVIATMLDENRKLGTAS
jgi:two-component system NtrC family sensor kinase